jgi:ubiquinone/menaquinone biosynthesis C-methylase UbiE
MKALLKNALGLGRNELSRIAWVKTELEALPRGTRLLDAGAGPQQYRKFCQHLQYVSQDFGQYNGKGDQCGLQAGSWSYLGIDIVCDITNIPEADASFDAILCTEVFEHISDPLEALDEFRRLLKPGGALILTAPFASLVHFAPYYFSSGFSRYWYQHHLAQRGFELVKLEENGDWYEFLSQEIARLPAMLARRSKLVSIAFMPVTLLMLVVARVSGFLGNRSRSTDVAVLGYHCLARKS